MALEICGKIAGNIVLDCDHPIQAGTEDTLILINRSDIASTTRNGANNEIVENIILNSGVEGYIYQGLNNSHKPKFSVVKIGPFKRWSHQTDFLAFGVLAAAKEEMQKLKDGDVCAIIYNKFKGVSGNGAFELYGLDAGLKVETLERDLANQETQGAFSISLMSDADTGLEPFPPKTIYITDYATTLAMIEGLFTV
ncbi:MAG: hypothetical protein V4549_18205 [Bacteroidota bacterium]